MENKFAEFMARLSALGEMSKKFSSQIEKITSLLDDDDLNSFFQMLTNKNITQEDYD